MKKIGLIFDMDGVVVDNDRFHFLAWMKFGEKYGFKLSFKKVISWFGGTNDEILKNLFKRDLSQEEIDLLAEEKESIYREIYKNDIVEVNGLSEFLKGLDMNSVKLALATSAPPKNVEFVLSKTGLTSFFTCITDDSEIINGKPDPEVFLKAAEKIGIESSDCVVFEDSFHGINAAIRAGMNVIGVATTHDASELINTDFNIEDFKMLKYKQIENLVLNNSQE